MNIKTVILLLAATVALGACVPGGYRSNGDDNYFSRFSSLPRQGWLYADTLVFAPDTLRDSVASGNIAVCIRHSADYRFSNIWLEVSYNDTDSTEVRDTVDMHLADNFGKWLGSGMGTSFLRTDTLAAPVSLRPHQQVRLRHIMRLDTLQGIEQAGIVFIPSSK